MGKIKPDSSGLETLSDSKAVKIYWGLSIFRLLFSPPKNRHKICARLNVAPYYNRWLSPLLFL